MAFSKDNRAPLRIVCNNFVDPLIFLLSAIIRSIFNLSDTLVFKNQISSKLMAFSSSPVVVVSAN